MNYIILHPLQGITAWTNNTITSTYRVSLHIIIKPTPCHGKVWFKSRTLATLTFYITGNISFLPRRSKLIIHENSSPPFHTQHNHYYWKKVLNESQYQHNTATHSHLPYLHKNHLAAVHTGMHILYTNIITDLFSLSVQKHCLLAAINSKTGKKLNMSLIWRVQDQVLTNSPLPF